MKFVQFPKIKYSYQDKAEYACYGYRSKSSPDKKDNDKDWGDLEPLPYKDIDRSVQLVEKCLESGECIEDLQAGNDYCYTAFLVKDVKGAEWVWFCGNGWAEKMGYPFFPENGTYFLLRGKTKAKFKELCNSSCFKNWEDLFSGNEDDLGYQIREEVKEALPTE
jgi:hypothetical protein